MTQSILKELVEYCLTSGIFKWKVNSAHRIEVGDIAGSIDKNGYRKIKIRGKYYLAHRLSWLYVTGEFPLNQIDHINGIRDDNRWCNLRESTQAENVQNYISNNKSGYQGVTWSKRKKKWQAQISINYKDVWLGYHNTPEEAHKAYLNAKSKYHTFQPILRNKQWQKH